MDNACLLSESQVEAILGRAVAAPEAREGAYDDLECRIPAPPDSDIPPVLSILMAAPVGEFNAERRVNHLAESGAGRWQLPTRQPAYFYAQAQGGNIVFALGDRVVTLRWRATEDETDDELAAMAIAFVEAISANWSDLPSAQPDRMLGLQTTYVITLGSVVLGYNDLDDWPASHEARGKEIGFEPAWDDETMGSYPSNQPPPYVGSGLSYGWLGDRWAENAYGLVIGEITDAGYHQQANDAEWRASGAEDLFRDLATVPRFGSGTPVYEVGRTEPTQLAGWPALSARVRSVEGNWPVLEDYDPAQHHAFVLDKAQQLIAADVGDSLVLAQIWAADEKTLEEWLPKAEALLAKMRIEPANYGSGSH